MRMFSWHTVALVRTDILPDPVVRVQGKDPPRDEETNQDTLRARSTSKKCRLLMLCLCRETVSLKDSLFANYYEGGKKCNAERKYCNPP